MLNVLLLNVLLLNVLPNIRRDAMRRVVHDDITQTQSTMTDADAKSLRQRVTVTVGDLYARISKFGPFAGQCPECNSRISNLCSHTVALVVSVVDHGPKWNVESWPTDTDTDTRRRRVRLMIKDMYNTLLGRKIKQCLREAGVHAHARAEAWLLAEFLPAESPATL